MRSIVVPIARHGASSCLRAGVARPISLPSRRNYASMPSKAQVLRQFDRASRSLKEESMSELQKKANMELFKDGGGPLLPGTFIALPLSQMPRSPKSFVRYQAARIKHWFIEAMSVLNFKLKSMPNWTTRPKWKAQRRRIAPTAKALYQEMLEAFAAGDKATLQRICVGDFAKKLTGAIDRRNPRERVRFEVTRYNNRLFYPRLKSHQINQINSFDKSSMLEHGIVAISSTQQASRYDASTGETIPGSVKIQDKVEYVVLSRNVNANTFESTAWRIWGTTSVTTLEGYLQEKAYIDKEMARRAGWKPTPK